MNEWNLILWASLLCGRSGVGKLLNRLQSISTWKVRSEFGSQEASDGWEEIANAALNGWVSQNNTPRARAHDSQWSDDSLQHEVCLFRQTCSSQECRTIAHQIRKTESWKWGSPLYRQWRWSFRLPLFLKLLKNCEFIHHWLQLSEKS